MKQNECERQQEVRNNNDIIPGFDDDSKNAHWRQWHDVSLDHPRISLAKVSQLKGCLLLRLAGPLTQASSGYFSERVLRAISAGYKRLIINCKHLDDSTRMNWYPLSMYGWDLLIVFTGLPITERDDIRQCWMTIGEDSFDRQIQFKNSEADAIRYLFDLEKEKCARVFADAFPCTIVCPSCSSSLRSTRQGLYRCSICAEMVRVACRQQ